ncbi:MAG: EamA family transporter [Candidatus Micrarchaeota archaeon]
MKMDWLALALGGMLFFSVSNIMLKLLVSNPSFAKIDYSAYYIPIGLVAAGVLAALYFISKNNPQLLYYALGLLFFALLGFGAMVLALEKGKVALVTAVLSLSTIVIAGLSFAFLGDKFTGKEIAAMVLAVLSLLVLVL